MKKSLKLLFCATALASLAGCNKFDEADTAPDSGNGSLIKVYAKVAENDGHPAPTSMSAKVPSRPNGKPATPWASCLSKPAARHRPRLPNSTTTQPRPHSKVRSTISQRAAAITMPSSPTRRSPAPRPTSRSGTCARRRATISTAPTTRWSPPPGHTPLTTRRARPTAKTSPSRCTALRRSSISPSPRRPTR